MTCKQTVLCIGFLLFSLSSGAQELSAKISPKVQALLKDPSMKHAAFAIAVLDAETGKELYGYNQQLGMAPASTLKVLTAMAALEQLGPDYRFETRLSYTGEIKNGTLSGNLVITGTGDPSLGSWRYSSFTEEKCWQQWMDMIRSKGIKKITGTVLINEAGWDQERTPEGWIWQDIGNYYGAGAGALNWRENQYDLILASGSSIGMPVSIIRTKPELHGVTIRSALTTAAKGTGDNAYIFLPPGSREGVVRGTIPLGETAFSISGAMPDPAAQLRESFKIKLSAAGIELAQDPIHSDLKNPEHLGTLYSPKLDSLVYWFLRKSINLYGEAMIKQLALKAGKSPSTEEGVDQLVSFWKQRGIEPGALQLMDGSGLSPQNRVTALALAKALHWSAGRPWYNLFYAGLPTYNGMKIKSGSINGARAYAGFHQAASGRKYAVAILVNNYTGSGSAAVRSLYSVLDALK